MSQPRILVVRGGAIGDFIMTLPAIGALRERWPGAHLEILGYPHITELANRRHYADATRSIEARALAGFFIPQGVLEPGLREYFAGFSLAISYLFDPDRVFAENVRVCGVKHLIEASPRPTDLPAAQHYCKPLESLAIYVTEPRPRVYPNAADRDAAAAWLGAPGAKPLVALHPGSGSPRKNWPVEKFGAVGRWLVDDAGAELLVVAGEADDQALAALRGELGARTYRVVRGLSLVALAGALERCAAYVGNDSGITHLAAAVNVPTVALFGIASVSIWEPRGDQVQVVRFGQGDTEHVRRTLAAWLQGA